MTNTIPAVVPPLPHDSSLNRHYAPPWACWAYYAIRKVV